MVNQDDIRHMDSPMPVQPVSSAKPDASREDEAFVTMVGTDDFVIGAEVMFHSLREHSRIRRQHVVIVTSEVSPLRRKALEAAADQVIEVRRRLPFALLDAHMVHKLQQLIPAPQCCGGSPFSAAVDTILNDFQRES